MRNMKGVGSLSKTLLTTASATPRRKGFDEQCNVSTLKKTHHMASELTFDNGGREPCFADS